MRKVTAISSTEDRVYAVCDDGTLWNLDLNGQWHQLAEIPDPPPAPAEPGTTGGTSAGSGTTGGTTTPQS